MDNAYELSARIAALEDEVAYLKARQRLHDEADELLEEALREHLTTAQVIARMFPLLGDHLGVEAAWVRTYDETLELCDFHWQEVQRDLVHDPDELAATLASEQELRRVTAGSTLVGLEIDVAGESFGATAVAWSRPRDDDEVEQALELLRVWLEELDQHLAGIAMARRKHQVVSSFADALKSSVLNVGIDQALGVLQEQVGFDDLILVYRHYDDVDGGTLTFKIIKDGEVGYDSHALQDAEIDAFVRDKGIDVLLRGDTSAVGERLGLRSFHEEVLISGLRPGQIVGRLLVARGACNDFNTFDRDLLRLFADFLRLRIVDFNREWRHLSLCFPRPTVRRLLSERDYVERYLLPRERDVAVLFCDIVGFTRVSEQVLRKPALIGELIDAWSERAVELIWQSGGVFDKMVGDCIIGLWGPPFFELSPQQACVAAARAAIGIRDYTATLDGTHGLAELQQAGGPMSVATGLNYCPLFVGRFGPNEGYTGFSSGMNNAARLQGLATRDEVLCLEPFVQAIGDGATFGEERQAPVKNVAEPLRFQPLEAVKASSEDA